MLEFYKKRNLSVEVKSHCFWLITSKLTLPRKV